MGIVDCDSKRCIPTLQPVRTLPEIKKRLRTELRSSLAKVSPDTQRTEAREIVSAIIARPDWAGSRCVLLFHALADEPDLSDLWRLAGERRLLLPRVDGDGLALHVVADPAGLLPGKWGVLEPDPTLHPRVPVSAPDLALVPGLAFTQAGDRLGRGAGFYDRLLASPGFRAATIGVCFRVQLVPHLPREPHDCRVARVLTAAG